MDRFITDLSVDELRETLRGVVQLPCRVQAGIQEVDDERFTIVVVSLKGRRIVLRFGTQPASPVSVALRVIDQSAIQLLSEAVRTPPHPSEN